jgi:hypothetical protein
VQLAQPAQVQLARQAHPTLPPEPALDNKGSHHLPNSAGKLELSELQLAALAKASVVKALRPAAQIEPKECDEEESDDEQKEKEPAKKKQEKEPAKKKQKVDDKEQHKQTLYQKWVSDHMQDKQWHPELTGKERFKAAAQSWKERSAAQLAPSTARGSDGNKLGCSKCRHSANGCSNCNPAKRAAKNADTTVAKDDQPDASKCKKGEKGEKCKESKKAKKGKKKSKCKQRGKKPRRVVLSDTESP